VCEREKVLDSWRLSHCVVGLQVGGYRCAGNSILTGCSRWCILEQNSAKNFAQGMHGSFLLSSSSPKPISKRDHCSYSSRSAERGAGAGEVNGMEGWRSN
jgi:hypothetical protein